MYSIYNSIYFFLYGEILRSSVYVTSEQDLGNCENVLSSLLNLKLNFILEAADDFGVLPVQHWTVLLSLLVDMFSTVIITSQNQYLLLPVYVLLKKYCGSFV